MDIPLFAPSCHGLLNSDNTETPLNWGCSLRESIKQEKPGPDFLVKKCKKAFALLERYAA